MAWQDIIGLIVFGGFIIALFAGMEYCDKEIHPPKDRYK